MTNKSLFKNVNPSRAEQRKQRLLEAEAELALEESDALKMTEEQRQILTKSFLPVKTEFSDLDGLRWTQNALREFQSRRVTLRSHPLSESGTNSIAALSNSDSPSLSSDNTICIASFSVNTRPIAQLHCRNRDGIRSRSSILGLFAACPMQQLVDSSHSNNAVT